MSLRARLLTGLVVLVTGGLIAMAGITYFEQRSFLLDRADEQARAAVPVVGRALGGEREPPHGPPRGDGGGGPPPQVTLPFGTYAQRRDAGGKAQRTIVYGGQSLPAPSWPK
ncbi:MAG: two-component system, OmpR family, sensor kinase, partial [Thermoleophilaceae bacterium]|nr:two-component system, OmpR family, sensor kinase [Thermoleophilaceae bacterium]